MLVDQAGVESLTLNTMSTRMQKKPVMETLVLAALRASGMFRCTALTLIDRSLKSITELVREDQQEKCQAEDMPAALEEALQMFTLTSTYMPKHTAIGLAINAHSSNWRQMRTLS